MSFYKQHLYIALGPSKQLTGHTNGNSSARVNGELLALSILETRGSDRALQTWHDDESVKLEARMTDIVIKVILVAEERYRESMVSRYNWRLERKAELEKEDHRRKLEAEKAEIERLRRLEEARVNRLLKDAAAFQQAMVIRSYVKAIQAIHSSSMTIPTRDLEHWSAWALAQADRIDPSIGRTFFKEMSEEHA